MEPVAIIGIGIEGFRSEIKELSYKELMYLAAVKAYEDAKISNPQEEIDAFVTCAEDYHEGTAIFDEYTPDQLGAVLKPMHTISGDGIQGLAAAYMQIASGLFDTVVVEAHSKASDIITHGLITNFAFDPHYARPFKVTPHFVAALEKRMYQEVTGTPEEAFARVVVKNHHNALHNPHAAYGMQLDLETVLDSDMVASPLTEMEIAKPADGAVVLVLANANLAKKEGREPIWIKGLSWATGTPNLDTRDWTTATYAYLCAQKAYRQAKIKNPAEQVDVFEIDDTYAYKELQHLEALGVYAPGEAGNAALLGELDSDGLTPVNVSGGVLGVGNTHENNGLVRIAELVLQLRGSAGARQLPDVETGMALSWRGVPTDTGALTILSNQE